MYESKKMCFSTDKNVKDGNGVFQVNILNCTNYLNINWEILLWMNVFEYHETSKVGLIGRVMACGPRDRSSSLTGWNYYYPPANKASREVANLTEWKNPYTPAFPDGGGGMKIVTPTFDIYPL